QSHIKAFDGNRIRRNGSPDNYHQNLLAESFQSYTLKGKLGYATTTLQLPQSLQLSCRRWALAK
ncbi:hypothetical protein, partial [Rhizobium sp. CF142]|uniref:hypothetical protein n=1 Tax=Rhizobium sp. CF142 TaxID=1144314 RepID=UPI001AEBF2E7